MLLFYW